VVALKAKPVQPINLGDISPADFVKEAVARGIFVFDLETTGLNPKTDRIEGIALYIPESNIIDEIGLLHRKEDGLEPGFVRRGPEIRAWFPFVPDTMRVLVHDGDPANQPWYENQRPAMVQHEVMETLRPLFEEHTKVVSIAHNAKFDSAFLIHSPGTDRGIRFNNRVACSMLLDFLGDENEKKYGLKQRVKLLLGHDMTTYEDVQRYKRQIVLPFMADKVKPLGAYAMEDTSWTYQLFVTAYRRIMDEDPSGTLERIYWNIDMPVCQIVEEMESAGVLIDWRWLRKITSKLEEEKEAILNRIEARLGFQVNPKSVPQVSTVLFGPKEQGYLGLSTKYVPFKEKGGHFATGAKEIGHLKRADPLVADLLDWKSKDTIQTSFSIKIPDIVIQDPEGRLHAKFNQNGTKIFRFSSSDPVNFQNQPRKKKLIRRAFVGHLPEEAAEIKLITSPEERKRREDMLLLLFGADYSQIELRVAAHWSGDPNMIEVYSSPTCMAEAGQPCAAFKVWACDECDKQGRKATKTFTPPDGQDTKVCPACGSDAIEHKKQCRHVDIHTRTAEDVGVPRNPLAKNLNFGNLYRIGPDRFCQYADLYDANGEPRVEYAREVIRGWFSAYPGIKPFHLLTEQHLKDNGWIAYTITGRRHRLKQSAMRNEYEAITQGIQFQVSGTAQDIIKIAMRNIVREREKKIANSRPAERALWKKYRMLIQVHDELIGEGPYSIRYEIKDLIERNMKGAAKLRVPLESTAKFGANWDDIH
jgi:DNA polymerase-1